MIDIGWYMDGNLPWRLAFVDDAACEALKRMQAAEAEICRLRKAGHQKRSPELRAARLMHAQIALCWQTLWEARELLAPPLRGSIFSRTREYSDRQAAVLRAADQMRGWDPVTGLWPRRQAV